MIQYVRQGCVGLRDALNQIQKCIEMHLGGYIYNRGEYNLQATEKALGSVYAVKADSPDDQP